MLHRNHVAAAIAFCAAIAVSVTAHGQKPRPLPRPFKRQAANPPEVEVKERWRVQANVRNLAFSPDSKFLAVGTIERFAQYQVTILEACSGKEVTRFPAPRSIVTLAFSPDGKFVAVSGGSLTAGDSSGLIQFFDVQKWRPCLKIQSALGSGPIQFSPDGKTLASGLHVENEDAVYLWDPADGKLQATLKPKQPVYDSPIQEDAHEVKEARQRRRGYTFASQLAFSPDNTILAVGYVDGPIRLWDWRARKQNDVIKPYRGKEEGFKLWDHWFMRHAESFPEQRREALQRLSYFDRRQHGLAMLVEVQPSWGQRIRDLSFSADGKRLAVTSRDPGISLYEINQRKLVSTIAAFDGGADCTRFSPDDKFLVSDHAFRVWDTKDLRTDICIKTDQPCRAPLAFSPDRKFLAAAVGDDELKVWEWKSIVEAIPLEPSLPKGRFSAPPGIGMGSQER